MNKWFNSPTPTNSPTVHWPACSSESECASVSSPPPKCGNSCQYGSCLEVPYGFLCQCRENFYGQYCQSYFSPCRRVLQFQDSFIISVLLVFNYQLIIRMIIINGYCWVFRVKLNFISYRNSIFISTTVWCKTTIQLPTQTYRDLITLKTILYIWY